jgi:hypothetical protein
MLLSISIIALVLKSNALANIQPRQNGSTGTSTSHTSITTKTTSSSPSTTYGDCCAVIANGVGLDLWYNSSVEITVATIITQIIQYDNTAITSLHTITNNASTSSGGWTFGEYSVGALTVSGVPSDLVYSGGEGNYAATMIATDTAITFDGTIVFVF